MLKTITVKKLLNELSNIQLIDIREPYEVEEGYIPVCARNRTSMKQDCRLQIKPSEAKKFLSKKFRYDDLKVESPALPRTIKSVKFCN